MVLSFLVIASGFGITTSYKGVGRAGWRIGGPIRVEWVGCSLN